MQWFQQNTFNNNNCHPTRHYTNPKKRVMVTSISSSTFPFTLWNLWKKRLVSLIESNWVYVIVRLIILLRDLSITKMFHTDIATQCTYYYSFSKKKNHLRINEFFFKKWILLYEWYMLKLLIFLSVKNCNKFQFKIKSM